MTRRLKAWNSSIKWTEPTSDTPSAELLARYCGRRDEAAAEELFRRYSGRLTALARSRLSQALASRVDAEDVVQSACRTFLRRARGGEFRLEDSASLWRLLCAITLTKVREQTRFHLRQKRGLNQEVAASDLAGEAAADFGPADRGPTPDEAVRQALQTFRKHLPGWLDFTPCRQSVDDEIRRIDGTRVAFDEVAGGGLRDKLFSLGV